MDRDCHMYINPSLMQVNDVKSNLNQIGYDIDMIHQMMAGLVSFFIVNSFLLTNLKLCSFVVYYWTGRKAWSYRRKAGGCFSTKIMFCFCSIHSWTIYRLLYLIFAKQDMTNSGLYYLMQVAGGIKDGINAKLYKVRYYYSLILYKVA